MSMKARWWTRALLAVGIFGAALAPRTSTWSGTFQRPVVLLEETDPYYHLRRIELALANDLRIPAVDSYLNHPEGARVDWPPGFDVFMALSWHLLAQVDPDPPAPAAVGAVGVAVLGSLAAALLAFLVTRWGLLAGLAAGLALAWSPAAVAYSRVGRLDHHALEPLVLVAFAGAYTWARDRPSAGRAVGLGLVLSLASWFWIGSAFYAAALVLAYGFEGWARRQGPGFEAPITYFTGAAAAAALALTSPWGREPEVVYYAISWFQPLLLGGLALALMAVARAMAAGVPPRKGWLLGAGGSAVVLAAVALAGVGSVGRGFEFLLGGDPVSSTLLESRSLLEAGPGYALRWLTLAGLATPVLWAVAWRREAGRGEPDPLLAAGLALAALALPLALLQIRFGSHLAVASGLLLGWGVGGAGRLRTAWAAVAVVAGVTAWGVRPATLPDSMVHPYVLGGFDALLWLRQRAPETSHFHHPEQAPEYGVAAEWVWGHWITQIGQKPNVANPLGQTRSNARGARDVARLLLAESDAEARAALRRLDVRYLLLSSIPATLPELATQAGRDPARYRVGAPGDPDAYTPAFRETLHARLYLGSGAGEEGTRPVDDVRLVFESRVGIDFLGPRRAVRIFEAVPGAVLVGRCTTEEVEARAELRGADVTYSVTMPPAADGVYRLRMPYASEETVASLAADISVRCGTRWTEVEVPEARVLQGDEVAVSPESGAGGAPP